MNLEQKVTNFIQILFKESPQTKISNNTKKRKKKEDKQIKLKSLRNKEAKTYHI